MSFLREIKRRKVFQVAAVYAVMAWLIIQIIDVVSEPLNLPDWLDTVVIVLLAVGFPIAVVLAWAFDLTPRGIQAASDVRVGDDPTQPAGRRFGYISQVLVLLAVGFLVFDQYVLEPRVSTDTTERSTEPVNRFDYDLPEGQLFRSMGRPVMALSPDGRQFVYNTLAGLYLRTMDELEARLIPGTEPNLNSPSFSPDGQSVVYYDLASRQLKRIAISGGAPVLIADVQVPPSGLSWEADGTILVGQPEGILRVSANGGTPELIIPTRGSESIYGPRLLPDGDSVLFTVRTGSQDWNSAHIVVQSLSAGERTVLVEGGGDARYLPTGHLVYALEDGLFAIAFDPESLTVSGGAVPLLQGVMRPLSGLSGGAQYDVSENGTLVYASGSASQRSLVWIDRDGREEVINAPPRNYVYAQLSPDGTQVALDARDQDNDIWIFDLERETLQRLTFDPGRNRAPIWSRDGRVAFSRQIGNTEEVYWQAVDGFGASEQLTEGSPVGMVPTDFSPDGKMLYMNALPPRDIWIVSVEGPATGGAPLLASEADEYNATISPDGRWLAYQSNESGVFQIYVRPYPDVDTGRQQISTAGGSHPLWGRDGRELFYLDFGAPNVGRRTLMTVSIEADTSFGAGTPEMLFEDKFLVPIAYRPVYDVSLDGQQFLMIKDAGGESEGERPQIIVVQNWLEELNRLAPPSE